MKLATLVAPRDPLVHRPFGNNAANSLSEVRIGAHRMIDKKSWEIKESCKPCHHKDQMQGF